VWCAATKDNFPALAPGLYKVRFDTTTYFRQAGVERFLYPYVDIVFQLEVCSPPPPLSSSMPCSSFSVPHARTKQGGQHYHIPLLISAHGYSTYRGS
jgi:5-hydroxyisourate hydrolase